MAFTLPPLPYELDALEPHMSKETLEFHHGKHHNTYVTKLNGLIENTKFASMNLADIIRQSDGSTFNNAAQVYNHTFFWNCLSPKKTSISSELADAINGAFGSLDKFKEEFTQSAINNFGSGWTWLVSNNGKLEIVNASNAGTPLRCQKQGDNSIVWDVSTVWDSSKKVASKTPILTVDVWEHAYYIDHRNLRPAFLKSFWELANWDFASKNFSS